uniref:Zinc finger, CCHC-type n=1 Tax=Tanacetum cinerariifolium TaxID=118510 RepID=A0A6L2K1M7_TANCI|nr:zinc finger, CCHC-type [Tanacetum cinerariifolium]
MIARLVMLATEPMDQAQKDQRMDDDVAWWVDSGATVHVCKDRYWFKTYESLNDGSILHMGNESTALVHRRGSVDLRLNIVSDNIGSAFMSTSKLNDSIISHARLGHVHFKRMQDMSKDRLIPAIDMDTGKCKTCMLSKITKKPIQNVKCETKVLELIHSNLCDLHATPSLGNKKYFVTFIDNASRVPNKRNRITPFELWTKKKPNLNYLRVWGCRASVSLPDPKLKTLGEIGIECIFVRYAEHFRAFRFYVIEPNESVSINSIIESMDVIFDKHMFSSVFRPSQRSLVKGTEDSSGSVAFERVTDEITFGLQIDLQRKLKVDGTIEKFKARLVIQDFKQKSGIDYFDTYALVARISTIRLLIAMASIHNLIIHQMDVKTAFLNGELEDEVYMNQPLSFIMPGNENKVDLTKELLSSKFSMKDMGEADVINSIRIKHESNVCTPLDTYEKLMPNRSLAVSQLEYSRVIGCLMYTMTCTRHDIAFAMGKLSSNTEDNSSTSGWVFMLGCGVISWASKKHTCITGSTIESEFVPLAAAGKEAKWLKNLLLEIPLWVKPIASISIRCDSAATLAKAYSQMYNGKSRHLGVRHSIIRELITNVVVSIEFVRSQQYLVDHLTKDLARDLVIKSVEGMRLKSN